MHSLLAVISLVSLLACAAAVNAGEAPAAWSSDLASEQKAAAQDGKPVVILVRNTWDAGTLDAGEWVREDAPLVPALAAFHRVMLWNFEAAAKTLSNEPKGGLVFLTAKGELIAIEPIPDLRAELKGVFDAVLKWPAPVDELAKAAAADPKDVDRVARVVHVLREVGRADHALQIVHLAAPAGTQLPPAVAAEAEDLELLAPQHAAQRLAKLADLFGRYIKPENPEARPKAIELQVALTALQASAVVGVAEDEAILKDARACGEALDAFSKNSGSADLEKTLQQKVEALAPGVKARADQLRKQAQDLRKERMEKDPASPRVVINQLRDFLETQQGKDEAKVRELTAKLLAMPMDAKRLRQAAEAIIFTFFWLDLDAERAQFAKRLEKELPTGRAAADLFLDLADLAYAKGQRDEADDYWKTAEKAAAKGESPVLQRAARAMRALADGKDSPRNTRWAKREILDVLVLVPDLETFAAAISQWDEKRFFPVLFQDDLYAPKFASAFKPSRTVLVPSVKKDGAKAFAPAQIRRAILSSWLSGDKKNAVPAEPRDEDLRARLKDLGDDPQGVIFGDGTSGETAGALALAAGRFEGFEVLPLPKVGQEKDERLAQPNDYLSQTAAWHLARQVREGLARWGLPFEDRWAAVTLAGAYPFRYSGPAYERWGTTFALDDLLGRNEDGTRIAATGRLLGDSSRSAYQAMCSLFLSPESAFLFNTYGLNPKSIWGQYRTDFAEEAWKERLHVTQFKGEQAKVETFRSRAIPWNRDGVMIVNSSGGAHEWSVAGGGGTPDDFPVGGPVAIHVTHSGTAAEVYDTDTLAGRAVWGGAFWYFGSTAEPFLTSFQPSWYFGPRIANGAPFSAVFRQRTVQNFWLPWRLMIVGDPLFCLREKPPEKKKRVQEDGMLIAKGERWLTGMGAVGFMEELPEFKDKEFDLWCLRLRMARWCADRDAVKVVLSQQPMGRPIDGGALAMILEECLLADDAHGAVKEWLAADDRARSNYAARIYARYAAASLMDKAQAASDAASLGKHFDELLTTAPAGNFVDRWLEKALALAQEKKDEAAFMTWLQARSNDAKLAAYKASFVSRINRLKSDALYRKEKWTVEDKAAALENLSQLLKAEKDARKIAASVESLGDAYLLKFEGAEYEGFKKDLGGLFPAGGEQAKALQDALAALEAKRSLHKDWLVLGSFTDAKAGAWEVVGPHAGKSQPDFTAVFKEGERRLQWTRPFKGGAFGIVDLAALLKPNENCYAYAAAMVAAEKDAEGLLLLGSDDGVTVWLDGKEIHRNPAARGVKVDEDRVPVKLAAGSHSLVMRIDQGGGGWGFCARFADKEGKGALPGVSMKCPELK
ncbi:MAG: hypothetical protein HY291_17120 [Planctomycetes bacterium]|nr:hypothetical protein [Planctomycetota bacterium]